MRGGGDTVTSGKKTTEDAGYVAVEGGDGNGKGDAGDGSCGVIPDTWESL